MQRGITEVTVRPLQIIISIILRAKWKTNYNKRFQNISISLCKLSGKIIFNFYNLNAKINSDVNTTREYNQTKIIGARTAWKSISYMRLTVCKANGVHFRCSPMKRAASEHLSFLMFSSPPRVTVFRLAWQPFSLTLLRGHWDASRSANDDNETKLYGLANIRAGRSVCAASLSFPRTRTRAPLAHPCEHPADSRR